MGSSRFLLSRDFTLTGKVAFGWIPEESIRMFGVGCEGCLTSGTFPVFPHDNEVTYSDSRCYGFKIAVGDDAFIWVEFRKNIPDLEPGLMLVWSKAAVGGVFGPTQLLDYRSDTSGIMDAVIPMGQSFVYTFGGHSFIISASAYDSFAIQTYIRIIESPTQDVVQISCNRPVQMTVDGKMLVKLAVNSPGYLQLSKIPCTTENEISMFLFDSLPLHLFLPTPFKSESKIPSGKLEFADVHLGAGSMYNTVFHSCTMEDEATCEYITISDLHPTFDGSWLKSDYFSDGKPVYYHGNYFLVYSQGKTNPGYTVAEWPLGSRKNVWFITDSIQFKSFFAFVLDSLKQSHGYMYSSTEKAFLVQPASVVDCFEEPPQIHIGDTLSATGQVLQPFLPSQYIVLEAALTSTIELQFTCTSISCDADSYLEQDTCIQCPRHMMSAAGSVGLSSCFIACDSIALTIEDSKYKGVYFQVEDNTHNEAPVFMLFGSKVRSQQMLLYFSGSRWVVGDDLGASEKIISQHSNNMHPLAGAIASPYRLNCACSGEDVYWYLDGCKKCPLSQASSPVAPLEEDFACFQSCVNINVQGDVIAGQFNHNGQYDNGYPVFTDRNSSTSLKASPNGQWYFKTDEMPNGFYLSIAVTTAGYWPTQGKPFDDVTISCSGSDIASNLWESVFRNDVAVITPNTSQPTSKASSTNQPSTKATVTKFPTSKAPNTSQPTTKAPNTNQPTTSAPVTKFPTSKAPNTSQPTRAPNTSQPITSVPVTKFPTSKAPNTSQPTTKAPNTNQPTKSAPVTKFPTSKAPNTSQPSTKSPNTSKPTAKVSNTNLPTAAPTTNYPTTRAPVLNQPTAESLVSNQPTSSGPTVIEPPATKHPTTKTTSQPVSNSPTTGRPTTPSPISDESNSSTDKAESPTIHVNVSLIQLATSQHTFTFSNTFDEEIHGTLYFKEALCQIFASAMDLKCGNSFFIQRIYQGSVKVDYVANLLADPPKVMQKILESSDENILQLQIPSTSISSGSIIVIVLVSSLLVGLVGYFWYRKNYSTKKPQEDFDKIKFENNPMILANIAGDIESLEFYNNPILEKMNI